MTKTTFKLRLTATNRNTTAATTTRTLVLTENSYSITSLNNTSATFNRRRKVRLSANDLNNTIGTKRTFVRASRFRVWQQRVSQATPKTKVMTMILLIFYHMNCDICQLISYYRLLLLINMSFINIGEKKEKQKKERFGQIFDAKFEKN